MSSAQDTSESGCPSVVQKIDPQLIEHSLDDRVAYMTDFLNFTSSDSDVIKKVAPLVDGMIPGLVDALYSKLFEFDITKKVFMARIQVNLHRAAHRQAGSAHGILVGRASMVRCPHN